MSITLYLSQQANAQKSFNKNYNDSLSNLASEHVLLNQQTQNLIEWGAILHRQISDDTEFCTKFPNKAKRINKLINKAIQLIQMVPSKESEKKQLSYLSKANNLLDKARLIHLR